MRNIITAILVIAALENTTAEPKEQSEVLFPPPGLRSFTIADNGPMGSRRVALTNNTPEIIRAELLDPSLLQQIAEAYALPKREAEGIRVMLFAKHEHLLLCQFEASDKTFDLMSDVLRMYTRSRYDGHSREFMMSSITNRAAMSRQPPSGDLQQLINNPFLRPVYGLKLSDSGTTTNKAGTVSRWSDYTVTDGDITWRYHLTFKPDGSLQHGWYSKFDAKEIDPQFRVTLEEVERLVTKEMKKDGSHGEFGSCHLFWMLKKEKLKERGILWRTPSELNPNTRFD